MEEYKRKLVEEEANASIDIWKYIFGFADIAAAKCAIDLKIPEAIENNPSSEPITLSELSSAVSASPSHLHRIMRFLVHQGIFKEVPTKDGLATGYTNTPLSRLMMMSKRDGKSMAPLVLFETRPEMLAPWLRLSSVVTSPINGGSTPSPFDAVHGKEVWSFAQDNPLLSEMLNEAMACKTRRVVPRVAGACHDLFKGVDRVVDVGGGTGETMGILVKEFPWVKGFNFDLAHVIKVAQVFEGVKNVEGDMFDSIPTCDAVLIKIDQSTANVNVKNHIEKPFVFRGTDFKRWQQKMLFYLTTLNLAQCLTSEGPELPVEGDIPDEIIKESELWTQNEFLCKNYILNALDDSLYDVYQIFQTPKELWNSLEKKYKSEVASAKKFIVGTFLNFKMSDIISVVKQVEEIQIIAHELKDEDMELNETFLVAAIIEKLPPTWKDFKIYLKHLSETMSLEQLILKLHVEEENRKNEQTDFSSIEAKANMIEGENSKSKGFNNKKKTKKGVIAPKSFNFKKKTQGACWVCGKPGHRAKDCRYKKEGYSKDDNKANLIENKFVAVVYEANMMTNSSDWWVDTGATKHVCSDKKMFIAYECGSGGEKLFRKNASTATIK